MLAMLCSAVFLKFDHIIKDVLMVLAMVSYIVIMHVTHADIFDAHDEFLVASVNKTLWVMGSEKGGVEIGLYLVYKIRLKPRCT